MMMAIKYAREQKIPFLGICLGFQLAVIEWARNVSQIASEDHSNKKIDCKYRLLITARTDATSSEFDPEAENPVVIFMPEISKTHMGGTMRLGLRPTVFQAGTETWCKARRLYGGAQTIYERHRHRYEVNPVYIERLQASGLEFVGKDEKGERMQMLELRGMLESVLHRWLNVYQAVFPPEHPYFLALQAHPEFCTRPLNPSPLFLGFVAAACEPLVLDEQLAIQEKSFQPPHPEHCMVSEEVFKNTQPSGDGKTQVPLVNGDA